jgi:hypothetical protein
MSDKLIDGWWQATDDRWYPPQAHPDVASGPMAAPPGWTQDDSGRWVPPPADVVPVSVVQIAPGGRRTRVFGLLLIGVAAVVVGAYSVSSAQTHQPTEVAVRSRTEIRDTTTAGPATTVTVAPSSDPAAPPAPPAVTTPTTIAIGWSGAPPVTLGAFTSFGKDKKAATKAPVGNFYAFLFGAAIAKARASIPTTTAPPSRGSSSTPTQPSKGSSATTSPPATAPPTTHAPTTTQPPPPPTTTAPPTTTTAPPATTDPPTTLVPPITLPVITLPSIPGRPQIDSATGDQLTLTDPSDQRLGANGP